MAVRITNRAKKSIRNLYWRSTRNSIQRKAETKSLVDAMIELVDTTPLIPSKENRGILSIWKSKGYSIFESTHCFIRYANGIECVPMNSRKTLKRKWYFACVVDSAHNIVYVVNAVFAKYVDRVYDDTPTAFKFMSAIKGLETRRKNKEAASRQLRFMFSENKSSTKSINRIISETINNYLKRKLLLVS